MIKYQYVFSQLQQKPKKWLVTGAAGFIGSNLVQKLLENNQIVVGLDNFATGYQTNLDQIEQTLSSDQWENFTFIEADIRDLEKCHQACKGIDYVLHQAALGSVPRSINNPIATNESNITGFFKYVSCS